MKSIQLLLIMLILSVQMNAQTVNGYFQTDDGAFDSSGWITNECTTIEGIEEDDGSGYYAQIESGNTQGCLYSNVYAEIDYWPNSGFTVYAQAKMDAEHPPGVIALELGYIDADGNITILVSDETSSLEWEELSVTFDDEIPENTTFIIKLNPGLVGGPAIGYAHFDDVESFVLLDIEHLEHDKNLNFFPNPANHTLYVSNSHIENPANFGVKIFDLLGREQISMNNCTENKVAIDVQALKNGMYFIQILKNGRATEVKSFTIVH